MWDNTNYNTMTMRDEVTMSSPCSDEIMTTTIIKYYDIDFVCDFDRITHIVSTMR